MGKPFSVLKTEVGNKIQDTSTSVATKIADAINRKYKEIWMLYPWVESIVINESFTITAGTVEQVLPGDIDVVFSITERANKKLLKPSSAYVYDLKYLGDVATSNSPIAYTPAGSVAIKTKISTTSTIRFVSSSTADTTQTMRLWVKDANGIMVTDSKALNGTSSAATTATYPAGWIYNCTKSALTTGTITVSDSAGALGYIGPRDYCNKHIRINLQAPPDQAYTAYVSGKRVFRELQYDEDQAEIDIDAALVHYGAAEIFKGRGKFSQAKVETSEGDRIISALVTAKEIMDDSIDETIPTVSRDDIDTPCLAG